MLIKIFLALMGCSLTLLVLAKILLILAVPGLSEPMTTFGLALLLAAFALLVVACLVFVVRCLSSQMQAYCSARQRSQRRLWFMQGYREQVEQGFTAKLAQLRYRYDGKRQRLLARNDKKHINALSKAIAKQLHIAKPELPQTAFRQLQNENSQYRNRLDGEGLLKLLQKITSAKSS
jgi:hypothetical protein